MSMSDTMPVAQTFSDVAKMVGGNIFAWTYGRLFSGENDILTSEA